MQIDEPASVQAPAVMLTRRTFQDMPLEIIRLILQHSIEQLFVPLGMSALCLCTVPAEELELQSSPYVSEIRLCRWPDLRNTGVLCRGRFRKRLKWFPQLYKHITAMQVNHDHFQRSWRDLISNVRSLGLICRLFYLEISPVYESALEKFITLRANEIEMWRTNPLFTDHDQELLHQTAHVFAAAEVKHMRLTWDVLCNPLAKPGVQRLTSLQARQIRHSVFLQRRKEHHHAHWTSVEGRLQAMEPRLCERANVLTYPIQASMKYDWYEYNLTAKIYHTIHMWERETRDDFKEEWIPKGAEARRVRAKRKVMIV